jgi:molybdopterin-guanine dinucleotide biosynthesis protein A
VNCSVLVLAGGRSRRFGRDKLQLDWRGERLLDHVVNRMRELSDNVIVLAAYEGDGYRAPSDSGVRIVPDTTAWPGPLVAVAAGLAEAVHDVVLVVGADMPVIPMRVLELMLRAIDTDEARSVVGLVADGQISALPLALRRDLTRFRAEELVETGARRLGELRGLDGAYAIDELVWKALDPRGDSLRDIDTETDLELLLAAPTES